MLKILKIKTKEEGGREKESLKTILCVCLLQSRRNLKWAFFFFNLGWSLTEATILCNLYSNVGFSKIRQGKLLLRDFYFFFPWLVIRSGLDAEDYETLSPTILRNGVAISHSLLRHATVCWTG